MSIDHILGVAALGGYALVLLLIAATIIGLARVQTRRLRIGIVAGLLLLGFSPIVAQAVRGRHWMDPFLPPGAEAGGTELEFELAPEVGAQISDQAVRSVIDKAERRLGDGSQLRHFISRRGPDRVAVFLKTDDPQQIKRARSLLTRAGTLELTIVANRRDHRDLIEYAQKSPVRDVVIAGKTIAQWRKIGPLRDAEGNPSPNRELTGNREIALRQIADEPEGFEELLVLYEPDENKRITGKLLKSARPTNDQYGKAGVGIQFTPRGGYLVQALTTEYRPTRDGYRRQLAVILDGEVFTAPRIEMPIGDNGIISSDHFTPEDVDAIVGGLNAGAMPIPLKPEPVQVRKLARAPVEYVDTLRRHFLILAVSVTWAAIVLLGIFCALLWVMWRFAGASRPGDETTQITAS